jgi:Na+-translocating ferredoxin:NAD+ oxidoreductase RnfG subunit
MILACLATAAAAASVADETVFDRNKGKIYAVYVRELKDNPGLKERVRVVLEMKISTDGLVANCRVVSSDAGAPGLGEKLCARTGEFQFAPRPTATTFTKELTFYPAA